MQNIYKLSIILSFFGLWLVSILTVQFQLILGFFFIFTFGIIHGTNDLALISKINNKRVISNYQILAMYLMVVVATVFAFTFWSFFTLIIFIFISAYHFGEQHFEYLEKVSRNFFSASFQFLYGLFILSVLFYCNAAEVATIITEMTGRIIDLQFFYNSQFVVGFLLFLNGIYIGIKSERFKSKIFVEIFYIIIFVIIFKATTLIWGFALYFILWHSIPSIISQIHFIDGFSNQTSIIKYLKTGFVFWLVSLLGMVIIYMLFSGDKLFYSLFFSFVIAITFPHVIVIQKMFSNKNKQIDC